jgi:hypothetical protein
MEEMEKDFEISVCKGIRAKDFDAGSLLISAMSVLPEELAFLCMSEYFRIGKDVRAAKLKSFDGFNVDDFISNIDDMVHDRNYIVLLARYKHKIIGELIGWIGDSGTTEAQIKSLYVENEMRGKRIAGALIIKFIRLVRMREKTSITVDIYNYNKQAKIAFGACDFKVVNSSDKYSTYRKTLNK